ncbi:MAG: nuclear transport factor 2 family protein [Pseudomonadales bacterium]|nr:nuclear transport factor 2 family protein [Pseudomonadales bacterium]MBO6704319.1 nuclear transport factor 2 family protein [Pseudomonadales bacterium]MBO7005350.1 nuclear transport factor 2 family protein [Pseudomonadales bacterium]
MATDRLEAAADKLEIMQLSATYMRGLDRLDGELERAVFWDDAWCSYGTYEGGPDKFVEYCMQALKIHGSNQHMLGQITVELEGEEAFGEVYYQAYHRIQNEQGEARDMFISGRYVDRYERRDGIWKIAYRSELVDWVRDEAAADDWFADSPMILGARKPDDPLYNREAMRKTS